MQPRYRNSQNLYSDHLALASTAAPCWVHVTHLECLTRKARSPHNTQCTTLPLKSTEAKQQQEHPYIPSYIHICTCMCVYVYTDTYVNVDMSVCVYTHMYLHVTFVCIYIRIYKHEYIFLYVYKYMFIGCTWRGI